MFHKISFKISMAMILVLLTSFFIMQIVLYKDFEKTSTKINLQSLETTSASVFQTLRMAMNFGDAQKIDEAIKDARSIDNIADIHLYPSKETIELFEIKDVEISSESVILEQFKKPEIKTLNFNKDGKNYMRLVRPLVADESCVSCHANAKIGDVIGVMDIYNSLENIERDLSRTSSTYAVIFGLALLITVILVLYVLRLVVIKPILELLSHAKDLAKGNGNLKDRIEIKGKGEIAKACFYINEFIEKIQKTILSTHTNSQNVDTQSKLLNENAIELNKITHENHQKTADSFNISQQVGSDLSDISALSLRANEANEKSYKLLEEMINSLFEVAKKASKSAQNENELAHKIEHMQAQANSIKKASDIMDDIADKTNLLSLNAGIEAARAGQFGRGFSVIAEDIRVLAQTSEESLVSIAAITKELLKNINEISNLMKNNASSINSLNEDASTLVNEASEVKSCNQNARDLVNLCVQRIKGSQAHIENLLESMQKSVQISNQNEEISKVLLGVADELKVVCHNLEKELSHFQI